MDIIMDWYQPVVLFFLDSLYFVFPLPFLLTYAFGFSFLALILISRVTFNKILPATNALACLIY